jgi:hypothetical protein
MVTRTMTPTKLRERLMELDGDSAEQYIGALEYVHERTPRSRDSRR